MEFEPQRSEKKETNLLVMIIVLLVILVIVIYAYISLTVEQKGASTKLVENKNIYIPQSTIALSPNEWSKEYDALIAKDEDSGVMLYLYSPFSRFIDKENGFFVIPFGVDYGNRNIQYYLATYTNSQHSNSQFLGTNILIEGIVTDKETENITISYKKNDGTDRTIFLKP